MSGIFAPSADSVVTEHTTRLSRGELFHIEAGPQDGPVLIFVHGWPEISLSYRHQLPTFGSLGFRAIAVDMPGHGRSVVHNTHEDYSYENVSKDLIELIDNLGIEKAVWIGHDQGSQVVWTLAAHHPERSHAVASLCVPYRMVEYGGADHVIAMVDRDVYPEDQYPEGPWDYMRFYEERFEDACAYFDEHAADFFKVMFAPGDPDSVGKPIELTSNVRKRGGWFGDNVPPPKVDLDTSIMDQQTYTAFVAAFKRTGFFGADSYYMNHKANIEYTKTAKNDGYLDIPALFLSAAYDPWCDTENNWKPGVQMRRHCLNLTAYHIDCGHWMQQEAPTQVNAAIANWLATSVKLWPALPTPNWREIPDDYQD
ncbi:Epoxide hydrolase A (plasmid) [Rhodococcus ruber]|uniref:alpha/beta fold hydrolase n=1 Tax=Rhodococcus ruber TaxID=1830 RepID=UPI00315DFBF5